MAKVNRPATVTGIKALVPRRQSDECASIPLTLLALLQPTSNPFIPAMEAKGYGPIPRRNELPPENLLLTLLPLTSPPFKADPHVRPYGPILTRQDLYAPENLTLTLLPTTQKPFKPDAMARPYGPILARQDLYAPENLTLTLLPTTQKPFKPFEWPAVPKTVAPRFSEAFENLLLTTLAGTPALAPFMPEMEDRDVPRWTAPARQAEAAQNLLLTLLPTTLAPFAPEMEDWDVPRLAIPTRPIDSSPNLLLTTLGIQSPFVPDEWAVNRWTPYRVAEPTQNRLLDLLPITQKPFQPFEWAPEQRASWRIAEASENILLTLLTTPAAPVPFENMEWSRPVVSPLRWAQPEPRNMALYPPVLAPFTAPEWVPMPARRGTQPSESYSNYVLKTLPQPKPFVNYDWVANCKTRTRYAPHADANLSLSLLYGLNPIGTPYWESSPAYRPMEFDAKDRLLKFPAKDRRFSLE